MRLVLTLGLLVVLCASANAAKVRRVKPPEGQLHQTERVTNPKTYVVPGWTGERSRKWLDDATATVGWGP